MPELSIADKPSYFTPPQVDLPSDQVLHALVYGDPGAGKTHFAATWPKPILYMSFDAVGKETPVLKLGNATPMKDNAREVTDKNGDLLVRVEYYHDTIVNKPQAYERFMTKLGTLNLELPKYKTLVLDSITSMELAARKQQQYKLNPNSKDPRQWYAGTTERLEEVLCIWLGALHNVNVVVLAHIDEEKDELHGTMIRNPAAPGRLRKRLAAYYPEMYRAFVKREGDKPAQYLLQTRSNNLYHATSVVAEAPDPCPQTFDALWVKGAN